MSDHDGHTINVGPVTVGKPIVPGLHRCGPTPEQVTDAALRGEVLGTWPRCDACAAKEADLLRHVIPRVEPMPPLTFEPLHFDETGTLSPTEEHPSGRGPKT